ncbi:probable beta-1,3-galactosyltransferase 2 isoform X1 [Olea europaea var. sylvestris]|uniref:Hexosyltransferase n=1 Tax=Olea europaea subsp. europaea TaxID=158383 RepID=A0A8S0VJE7_OLEEU|nr:probable beta-1,3-galactosyltransferase 2 isoform X1 [Olea europaea var. sylvestris]CAA3029525.1 probable beta-1,3-galactosyltransferase 2 isoform X1 [Olea europaea subsp. europaea]
MSMKSRGGEQISRSTISKKWTLFLCLASFCAGLFLTNRMWTVPESEGVTRTTAAEAEALKLVSEGCDPKFQKDVKSVPKEIFGEVSKTHKAIKTLDKTISNLEMELAAAKAAQESILAGSPVSEATENGDSFRKRKFLMVIGINTAFSSRKRRDSVRSTWMPQGEKRRKLEEEKGIIVRFVIGHSATLGGILDRAIEAENKKHGDILRLDHVEGYLELSAKTKTYFATAVALWDAEYYVKVDDDVHVNIATLGETLVRHRKKPRVYIGCMKSGPVLAQKGVRYHEPEYWKFGENGNKYFRHATGQLYAISKDLASFISLNRHVLHKYANEDVSLGSWFIGLDVQHIDDRRLCCGTPPDCEWKAQAGNACVASFDWSCSGICRSADRIKEVHRRCGEGEDVLWKAAF